MPKLQMLPWSEFNALGQNAAVRSSYLWVVFVPILAKVLSAVPQDYLLPVFGLKVSLVLGVPFTWELLYYSAIFFALASLAYSIFCPEIVKRYAKYADFLGEGKGEDQIIAYLYGPMAGRGNTFPFRGVGRMNLLRALQAYAVGFSGIDPDDPAHLDLIKGDSVDESILPRRISLNQDSLPDAFWFVRDIYDQQSPIARSIVFLLFLGGFSLVFWILLQNFWYVVSRHIN